MDMLYIPRRLSIKDIISVAYNTSRVNLSKIFAHNIQRTREYIEKISGEEKTIYGVTTGVGALATKKISAQEAKKLQEKILVSHAVGYGCFLDDKIVRATMFIRANMLSRGYSGVRPEIIVLLCGLLNENVVPCVPRYGSVGASGDLAPLAHIALVVVGSHYGYARINGRTVTGFELKRALFNIYKKYLENFYREVFPSKDALDFINLDALKNPKKNLIELSYKEGIALINGTDVESAILALGLHRISNLIEWSKKALCLSIEAIRGILDAFDPEVISLLNSDASKRFANDVFNYLKDSKLVVRPNDTIRFGELLSRLKIEENIIYIEIPLRKLLLFGVQPQKLVGILRDRLAEYGPEIFFTIDTEKVTFLIKNLDNPKVIRDLEISFYELGYVQDAYSFRCCPKVYGIAYDFIRYAKNILLKEINSITDNPLILCNDDCRVVSSGHFHGQPAAFIADCLAIAITHIAGISERRIFRLLDPNLNRGLPAFLIPETGFDSGFMITQYVAAALQSINNILSHPSSIYSLPTSANQEDWNSMGMNSALKLLEAIDNFKRIVATEILCASQAILLRTGGDLSYMATKTREILENILRHVDLPALEDRYFKEDIDKIEKIIEG